MLGSRAWGRVCAAWRVPVGPAEPAAPGRGGTLRRAVLGTWGSGLIAAVSSPQQAYSVALSPHPSECGQCPGHSVLTRQQVAGRLRTEPAGPGIARDPPPRSSGSSERRPGQGCPAEMLLMENPQQPGPRPRCDTHSSRPRGVGGAAASCFPLMSPMGGSAPSRQRGRTLAGLQPAVPSGPGHAGVRQGAHGERAGQDAGWKNPSAGRELRRGGLQEPRGRGPRPPRGLMGGGHHEWPPPGD